ncbi:hypothetical protein, partial [Larkinella punicea]|uniref:hypothetical protein n=1 Tax=Larkinella punicea TaxID=2315727 RepID=UPI001CA405AC
VGAQNGKSAPNCFSADLQITLSHHQRAYGRFCLNSKFGMTHVISSRVCFARRLDGFLKQILVELSLFYLFYQQLPIIFIPATIH